MYVFFLYIKINYEYIELIKKKKRFFNYIDVMTNSINEIFYNTIFYSNNDNPVNRRKI